jgi:CubicO group peptidase (beta-lactamase class C family)
MRSRTIRLQALALAFLLAAPAAAQQDQQPQPSTYTRALAAGHKALTLCEGVFSAGRSEAQIAAVELKGLYTELDPLIPTLPGTINRTARAVTIAFDESLPPRRADHSPGFGCTLAAIGATASAFAPTLHPHPSIPVPADGRPWPSGDAGIVAKPSAALAATIANAFGPGRYGSGTTVGVVVLRDGKVVAERYAEGFGPLTPNRTWSVAKSIAGTLVGVAARELEIDPMKPAAIPEWRTPGDPRQAITLDQLLRMSSGLHSDTAGNRTDAIYFGGATVTEQATGWPIVAMPGTRFRYANNDILLAVRAVRAAMNDDNRYSSWPRDGLFFPLGMQHTTTGADWQRNYILSSQVWSTARDLARLGQFWLQDGVWQGKRILPEGWMRYMTTPSGPQPASGPGYGATLWLFGPKQGLPEGSYAAQGNRGQYIMVIPSRRLVIVRRGEDPGAARFDIAKFAADVAETF